MPLLRSKTGSLCISPQKQPMRNSFKFTRKRKLGSFARLNPNCKLIQRRNASARQSRQLREAQRRSNLTIFIMHPPSLRAEGEAIQQFAPCPIPCVIIGLDPIILPESAHVQMFSVAEHGSKSRDNALHAACCMETINTSLSRRQQAGCFRTTPRDLPHCTSTLKADLVQVFQVYSQAETCSGALD